MDIPNFKIIPQHLKHVFLNMYMENQVMVPFTLQKITLGQNLLDKTLFFTIEYNFCKHRTHKLLKL